jgi:glycosyltransferase involved in cell wall biosynthesis
VNGPPRLSVVIATKDREAFLRQALASLGEQRGAPPFEVVVADNGSTDGTEALARNWPAGAPDVAYCYVAEPNRGAARNAGIALARGEIVVFVDDDVVLPQSFLAAHAAAHAGDGAHAVSGPIVNVADAGARPAPSSANFSNAFFCTCNVSVPRAALDAVGGFDEAFNLYGWEDTELGLRLRKSGVRRGFAWGAYLWHIKPPESDTLEVQLAKVTERAQMAVRLLAKDAGWRARLATGAYAVNLARAAVFAPGWSADFFRTLAGNRGLPGWLRAFGRAQLLDAVYTSTLRRELTRARGARP